MSEEPLIGRKKNRRFDDPSRDPWKKLREKPGITIIDTAVRKPDA